MLLCHFGDFVRKILLFRTAVARAESANTISKAAQVKKPEADRRVRWALSLS